jgi:hypothetical protein
MIYKNIDKKVKTNKFIKAGDESEKQMAFYLKRAFQNEEKIIVLNDLRIIIDGEVAQIDHLVVHAFGFIIIESKSVTSEVSINKYDEWCRIYNNQKKGMPSPIKQAERQIEILKELLDNHAHEIFKENFFNKLLKPKFSNYNFDIFIAISDNGMIERENETQFDNIVKAEQITGKIKNLVKHYYMENINPLRMVPHQESKVTLIERTAKFLAEKHQSLSIQEENLEKEKIVIEQSAEPIIIKKKRVTQEEKPPQITCSKCQSLNIEIQYGKYGYYFKCLSCDGNTALKLKCKDSKCKPKLQKRKLVFHQVCDICGNKKLFFTNKELAVL